MGIVRPDKPTSGPARKNGTDHEVVPGPCTMYMADHDIVLIALIATHANWTRHRGPFAPHMSCASGTAHIGRESR